MKSILTLFLTMLLCLLAATSMAERYYSHETRRGDPGDRVERHFDRLAHRAAFHGDYRAAIRLHRQGDRIDHRLDRHRNQHVRHGNKHHRHLHRHLPGSACTTGPWWFREHTRHRPGRHQHDQIWFGFRLGR